MQIKLTHENGLKRIFTVVVDATEIEAQTQKKLVKIGQTAKIPGFRPGKAPMDFLKKRFGDSVMGEVLDEVVSQSGQKALDDHKIRPAVRPKVEVTKFDEGKDLEFSIEVEALPEIPEVNFKDIKLKRLKAEPSEKEVNVFLERFAESYKTTEAIKTKRETKEGDTVLIDFVGKIDGVAFPGGTGNDYGLELGSKTFIPGFEDQLIGKKVGDEVNVEVSFPENYGSAELAGKPAVFEVKVKEIQKQVKSKIDEDLARRAGYKDLEALTRVGTQHLQSQLDQISTTLLKKDLFENLDKLTFDLPETLIEDELAAAKKEEQGDHDHDHEHGEHCNHDHEHTADCGHEDKAEEPKKKLTAAEKKAETELKAKVERRIKLGLILSGTAEKHNIQVQEADIRQAIQKEVANYPGQEQQVIEYLTKNKGYINGLKSTIMESKVIDYMLELASIKEESVSKEKLEELMKKEAEV